MSTDGPCKTGPSPQDEKLLSIEFSDEADLFGGWGGPQPFEARIGRLVRSLDPRGVRQIWLFLNHAFGRGRATRRERE